MQEEIEMMTYYDVINELKNCALEEPNINYAGSKDIFELNALPDIDYDVFYITPNQHRLFEDTIRFSLNLYFVTRWDNTDDNQLIIHSNGIIKLLNIINRFNERFPEVGLSFPGTVTTFYQKFKDMCAGVYVTLEFVLPNILGCEHYE